MAAEPQVMVIVNPSAAGGANGRLWAGTAECLRRVLPRFAHAFTEAPGHATRLARQALLGGADMVVAVGGDGTLNEVACGFFEGERSLMPKAALGVVPVGTGSDFARTLGGGSIDAACARLGGRKSRLVDVGQARFLDHEGVTRERLFLNVASFGCSGEIARGISPRIKRLSGPVAYAFATLRTLLTHRDHTVAISLDERPAELFPVTACAFCNGRYFGGGMQVAPQARLDDGLFDVTLWSGFGLIDFVRKGRSLYSGAHVLEAGTRVFHARQASASSTARVAFELDGEGVGQLPVQLKILPRALRLMCFATGGFA
jgi:YegS/Rv2252/BmrU family lipid kinase